MQQLSSYHDTLADVIVSSRGGINRPKAMARIMKPFLRLDTDIKTLLFSDVFEATWPVPQGGFLSV